MSDYTIGSVASLISQNKVIKIKLKKKNSKGNEQKPGWELLGTDTEENIVKKQTSKHKNKNNTLKRVFQQLENPITNLNPTYLENNILINKKKRKSFGNENSESKSPGNDKERKKSDDEPKRISQKGFESGYKTSKMGIDLNFVPSDSKEEVKEKNKSLRNFDRKKPQDSNQKRKHTDFTECTVFVGNIPINYDKQKICKMFSKFGKIQSARIRCVPIADINMPKKVAAIKKQFNFKRNSLVAYVKYETQDSANAALNANGMIIDGHHLRVDLAEGSKENDNKKAVFVGGLPFDIEDDELWEFFQNCGKINSVRVIRDSQTSMGKGFGYVNFDSTAAVELALQMNGEELKKRTINVKRCVKARNKNKLNAFGRKKSKEMTDQLLSKKGKKFKEKKKKQNKGLQFLGDFQGRKANIKEKKNKKLSKSDLRQRKLVKILGASKG